MMEPKHSAFRTEQPASGGSEEVKATSSRYADETLRLVEGHGNEFGAASPETTKQLKRKTQRWLVTLLCAINLMLFVRLRNCAASSK